MIIKNPYIKDKGNKLTPVYFPGEQYSFYINFDTPVNDPDFSKFVLNICYNNTIIYGNVGYLKKHIVKGVNLYNIYSTFVFPDIPEGTYQFVIFDPINNVEKCRSNCILVAKTDVNNICQKLVYYDSENIFNYYYELLPWFRNRFHLPIAKIEYQFESERTQYRNVTNNKFRNLRSYRDILYKIESYNFDEHAHTAMSTVYEHENVYIENNGITPKGAYSINQNQLAALTKGNVDAYLNGETFTDQIETEFITVSTNKFYLLNASPIKTFTLSSSSEWQLVTTIPAYFTVTPSTGLRGDTIITLTRVSNGQSALIFKNMVSNQTVKIYVISVSIVEWVLEHAVWNNLGEWQSTGIWHY